MARSIILIQISLLCGLVGLMLWRSAIADVGGFQLEVDSAGGQLVSLFGEWKFWLGTLALLVVALIGLELYGNEELSRIVPLYSIGYVYTVLLGQFVLDENVTTQRWVGTAIIMAGVFLVARS